VPTITASPLKQELLAELAQAGYQVVDCWRSAAAARGRLPTVCRPGHCRLRASDDAEARAILICGSGQGMCMAANRYKGIRASLVWSLKEARASRNDDDSNVRACRRVISTLPQPCNSAKPGWRRRLPGAARFKTAH